MACVRCPVCLAGDGDGAWSAVAACGHVLHTACLEQCMQANAKCPCCRTVITRRGANPGHRRVFLDVEPDGGDTASPGRAAEVLADERVQRLTRANADLRDDLTTTRAALADAEARLADADAERADAVADAEAAAEAALLAARAELDAATARAGDAVRERDGALAAKFAAEKRAERLAAAAKAATDRAAALRRDLDRAALAGADVEALSDADVAALVGAACAGADARALAAAAAKLAAAGRSARSLRGALADRERALAAERAELASVKAELARVRAAASASEAAVRPRSAAAVAAAAAADAPRASARPHADAYDIDYDTADVIVDDGDDDCAAGGLENWPPTAAAPISAAVRPPPLVGAARLGSSAGLKAASFVKRRPSDGSQGTFIRHGADGRGGRTAAVRPRGVAASAFVAAAAAVPLAKRARQAAPAPNGSLAGFFVQQQRPR